MKSIVQSEYITENREAVNLQNNTFQAAVVSCAALEMVSRRTRIVIPYNLRVRVLSQSVIPS